jgi:hypothetical protein
VIVRISMEDQYLVQDEEMLEALDQAAIAAVEAHDEAAFRAAYDELLAFVRAGGPVDADHLGGSDLILPPADVTLAEARTEFSGEGLLPS